MIRLIAHRSHGFLVHHLPQPPPKTLAPFGLSPSTCTRRVKALLAGCISLIPRTFRQPSTTTYTRYFNTPSFLPERHNIWVTYKCTLHPVNPLTSPFDISSLPFSAFLLPSSFATTPSAGWREKGSYLPFSFSSSLLAFSPPSPRSELTPNLRPALSTTIQPLFPLSQAPSASLTPSTAQRPLKPQHRRSNPSPLPRTNTTRRQATKPTLFFLLLLLRTPKSS